MASSETGVAPSPTSSTGAASASATSASGAVLCPHCENELPHDLFTARPPPPAPEQSGPVSSGPGGPMTTDSLKASLDDSERAETSADAVLISTDDLRRWSQLAGVPFIPPPAPLPSDSPSSSPEGGSTPTASARKGQGAPAPVVPLIPAPPSATPRTPASSRFGFFARAKSKLSVADDGDDSDDEGGGPTGYARVGGPGSDDSDDDGYESDKPFTPRRKQGETKGETKGEEQDTRTESADNAAATATATETATATATTTATATAVPANGPVVPDHAVDELRKILGEVVSRVQLLTVSHSELLSSHSTLLTSLKIARSNLVMAEANTEMLEDEIKRLKAPSTAGFARAETPRGSTERRPSLASVSSSANSSAASAAPVPAAPKSSSGFGFWKKTAATDSDTGGAGSSTPGHTRQLSDTRDEELRQLRAQLASQGGELAALQQGKKEIEAELEGLSQALFEEANKMVADERRRRAEIEDSLRETRAEREALRQTVRVLGGRVRTPVPGGATPAGELSEGDALGSLDAHYEALRRGIHHAVDGPSPMADSPGRRGSGNDGGSPTPSEGSSESEVEAAVEEDSGYEGGADTEAEGDDAGGSTRTRSNTVSTLRPNGRGLSMGVGTDETTPTPPAHATLETGIPAPAGPIEAEANPWG